MTTVIRWLDERAGLRPFFRAIFLRHIPVGTDWWYSLGSAALFLFLLQVATGTLLAMSYSPTPERAYDSIRFIMGEVPFGWFIRGLHHWGASAMVAVVLLHLVSVFVMGSHRYPREAIWLAGVGLFLVTLGFGFTGYLLPWDQKAYWATTVGTNMAGTVPGVGPALVKLIRGSTEVGAVTLVRFYAMHTLLFPLAISALATIHLVLVVYHGVSVPPGLWHKGQAAKPKDNPGAEKASIYQERYAAFKSRGSTFWPDLIVEDLRTALFIFLILIGLTVFVGVPLDERADPTDTSYIPRPEWYFMALFEILKYFPGHLEWVGVALVPGLVVLLIVLVPWLSGGEERRALRRPLGMVTLALILVATTGLTVRAYQATPPSQMVEWGLPLTSQQLRGRQLIQQQGCRSCHVIAAKTEWKEGSGTTERVQGPTLDGIRERMTTADIHFFMEKPKAINPEATMKPLIPPLSHEDVEAITQYLLTLEGEVRQDE
ncbi:MAG: Quinol:cytochrome oxidoreductase [Dehalococcoidia bacterium]|nr:Quinol:cytochrome oxidoreductase [Dehalococcoidia bacterium]